MKLNQFQTEVLNLLSNDLSTLEIAKVLLCSRSKVNNEVSELKEIHKIKTTHGLVGQYLNDLYFNKKDDYILEVNHNSKAYKDNTIKSAILDVFDLTELTPINLTEDEIFNESLLVETDSPFLAPMPNRGALNTPAQIPNTLRVIADLRGESVDYLAQAISENAERIFGSF